MRKGHLYLSRRIMALMCVLTISMSMFSGCNSEEKKDRSGKGTKKTEAYLDASKSTEERVADLMSKMTIKQKVAQMIMAERNAAGGGAGFIEAKNYGLGAILSGGGSAPQSGNNIEDWSECINGYKKAAAESELGIPILYGVDSIHGNNNVYGTTVFPHQIGLGATGNTELVETIGGITAMETRAMGANYIFSPVLGIPDNERWGRTYECFGEKEKLVTELGTAYINGLQGVLGSEEFLSTTKVIASAKHFIGEGQTANGGNQGFVMMKEEEWNDELTNRLILPYKAAIEAGVQTIMVSYNYVNFVNCHESKELITDLLKGELGFGGIVISDYDGVEHCDGDSYKEQLANCVNAGVDMLMEPLDWQNCYYTLLGLAEDKTVSEERINDAVKRILTVKFNAGLFEEQIESEEEKKLAEEVGSDEHRGVARRAVRESITLLKNDTLASGKTVMEALADYKRIAVVGDKADDIGTQCGGWTISWNGSAGDTTIGTTILKGFKEVAADKEFTYSQDAGAISKETEAVIVVVGEEPYSESAGDKGELGLRLTPAESTLIRDAKEAVGRDVPVIVILITGRPLTIAEDIGNMDALICAWLPGTEGAGIADVMFGDYEFNGTTTITWPWYAKDITEKYKDDGVVLFRYGTGLKKDGSSIKKEGTKTIGTKPQEEE